jgi:hypothetical protein
MNTTGKKFGGRKEGTPNKLTRELRGELKNFISKELENLSSNFEQITPKERIELLSKLLPYAMPKVTPESFEISEGGHGDAWI